MYYVLQGRFETVRRTLKVRRPPASLIMACHEIGKRRTATERHTQSSALIGPEGPVTIAAHPITARSASVGLSRERGEGKGNRISPENVRVRTTQGCRPGKSLKDWPSRQQRGRRPHTGRQARVPDHGNSMRSAELSIPLTGFPIDWRKTGRQEKPQPKERDGASRGR